MIDRGGLVSRRDWLKTAALAAVSVRAQDSTFSSDVKVVNVLATVRNGKGEIVRNLTKDDFVIEEDAQPQAIRYFSRETDLPLTLGLLVDVSASQRRVLGEERRASFAFLQQVLREEKDQAFVIQFEREVELVKDLTRSRKELESAVNSLDAPELQRPGWGSGRGGYPGGRRGGGWGRGGTSLYDAVYLAGEDVLRKQAGRKAVIVLSDGVDNASKINLTDAVETAQRADTLVYSILFTDQREGRPAGFGPIFGPGMGGGRRGRGRMPQASSLDGKKVLERISKETGGAFFEVSNKHPLEEIYKRIEEDLRSQYSLGYSPQTAAGTGYRKIHVTTKQKGLVVQARDGYYGGG